LALNDKQANSYMSYRNQGKTQVIAALKSGVSVRSGRRIEKGEHCPNSGKLRSWRTRKDPFVQVWQEMIEPLLSSRPTVMPITVLELLQQQYPGQFPDSLFRTLQRRIKEWKLKFGEAPEVMFRQEHHPGVQGLSDFTELKGVQITLNHQPFSHRLFHFRLAWSRWSWMRVVIGGESFTALAEGLQEALSQLGGVPLEHRTDSLSAAWKNLSDDDKGDLTSRYEGLCAHYGMAPTRNNAGRGHENGSVESAHGHLKRRIRQALLLRGSQDFPTLEAYREFITQQVLRHNQRNQDLIKQESPHLQPLPQQRCADYQELSARVSSSSTITVQLVQYSVPPRLIGQMLKIHLWDDRLSGYIGNHEVVTRARIRPPKGKRRAFSIDFRDVVPALAKKPQAFYHATLRDHILPGEEWRQLWNALCLRVTPKAACSLMVHALSLAAKREDINTVSQALRAVLREPGEPALRKLLGYLGMPPGTLPNGVVTQHELSGYDQLLNHGGYSA